RAPATAPAGWAGRGPRRPPAPPAPPPPGPVVAGRDGEVVRLADSPPTPAHDRRRLRGNRP
ncbi:hypothetical protein ACFV00_12680, partial [Streptomyces californicus]|uniref:hypothetical protein n=1 Tax=Streptomyces californicus TaxID=67351 RepID=UPI00368A64C4